MKHTLVLPTNRECLSNIKAYILEGIYAQDVLNKDVSIVVIDTSDVQTQKSHDKLIKEYKNMIPIFYFNDEKMDLFLGTTLSSMKLSVETHKRLLKILNPKICSYGAAANKTFLVSAALGADYLHRRDSDTLPQKLEGRFLYPIEKELCYLGRKMDDLKDIDLETNFTESEDFKDSPVFMCGGNYLGAWAADLKEMYESNKDVFYDYLSFGVPNEKKAHVVELLEERYINQENKVYKELHVEKVSRKIIEVGNHGLYRIFQSLPLLPSVNAISTDYLYHNILAQLHIPMIYHNWHVHHNHTSDRKTLSWFFEYHMRLIKHRMLYVYIKQILNKMAEDKKNIFDSNYHINDLNLVKIIHEVLKIDFSHEMDELVAAIIEIFRKMELPSYDELCDLLISRKEFLKTEVLSDFDDYALLVSNWESLASNSSNGLKAVYPHE